MNRSDEPVQLSSRAAQLAEHIYEVSPDPPLALGVGTLDHVHGRKIHSEEVANNLLASNADVPLGWRIDDEVFASSMNTEAVVGRPFHRVPPSKAFVRVITL